MAPTSHVAGLLTTSKWYVRATISTLNFAVGVDGNPQPCYIRYWIEVIVFMLLYTVIYLCYKSSSTVCVSIPIQGWHLCTETWPSEVGSLQDGIRAHVDCRMWPLETGKPLTDFFSLKLYFQKDLFLSSLLSLFKYSILVRLYPFPFLTTRRFDWWDHPKKYEISDN